MSATNLTTLNGEFVKDFVILRDGDEFCIGLRQFKYQSGGKILLTNSAFDLPPLKSISSNIIPQIKNGTRIL